MTEAFTSTGLARLHDALAGRVDRGELPGLVTVLARGDEVHVDTIGAYAFGDGRPMSRDTIFRIASCTKPIVATVAMMLVEDGLFTLDEPVDRLLPELADRRVLVRVDGPLDETVPARRPITVEDLLTFRLGHGLLMEPEYNPKFPIVTAAQEMRLTLAEPDPRTPHPPDEWIKLFGSLPLMYQPGERWQYNTGALVLGVLVARAAGVPLPELLRDRLFEPLGMTETGFWTAPENIGRIPAYYMTDFATGQVTLQQSSPPEVWQTAPVFPSAAAGLLSTADDLLAFGRLLAHGGVHKGRRLLSAESVAAMTTNRLTQEQIDSAGVLLQPKGWGLGMAAVASHYGWDGGYGTVWFNDPSLDLTAIALTQNSDFLFAGGREEFTALARAAVA